MKNKKKKNFFLYCFLIFTIVLVIFIIYPLPAGLHPPLSKIIRFNNGKIAHVFLAQDDQYRIYIDLSKIPSKLQKFILMKEDQYFYYHFGVNPIALLKAFVRLIKYGKVINGGSTITMQLARITEPKKRTVFNKLIEILRAVQFEIKLSKKKILEYYLNYAPFGKNVVGIEAASFFYFGKSMEELNISEMAILANLPQVPGINFLKNKSFLKKKRNFLLLKLFKKHIISLKEYKKALKEDINISYHKFPQKLQHLSDYLYLYGKGNDFTTTISEGLQEYVESKLKNHKYWLISHGITNASIVLMDIKSGKVLAIIGSLDYANKNNNGQVRGFFALRSPGSTLKPFLYALAIDKGLITPATKLKDVPISFKDFIPANFDNQYRGLVSAETALSQSLNIPFVRLLKKTGKDNFLNFLKSVGFYNLKENDYYGLSIILGACDVNLLELTNGYRIFPNLGLYSDYYFIKNKKVKKTARLLSQGSSYLTMRAISLRNNPEIPEEYEDKPYLNKIKWKTGTSKNFKDAWTVGFGNKYALGVWVGNFNGKSSTSLIGVQAAAPIFFDILGNIEKKIKDSSIKIPDDLTLIKVCPLSGKRVTENCPNFIYTYTLRNREYTEYCNIHKKYLIEKNNNFRVTSLFPGIGELEFKVFVVFPPDVKNYIRHYNKLYTALPPIDPRCYQYNNSDNLKVISPQNNMVYLKTKNGRIPLIVYSRKNNDHFYWFLDGNFYKKSTIDSNIYIKPDIGKHELEVLNDGGLSKKIVFYMY